MERDPLRLAWTTSRARHALGAVLLAVAGLGVVLGLSLVSVLVDGGMRAGDPAPLLRLEVTGLARFGIAPIEIFPGFTLDRGTHLIAVLGALALAPLLVAALLAAILGGIAGMRFHRKVDKAGLGR